MLELVQSLDELVPGTRVVGNYFRGNKKWKLSADLLPWSGSSRVMWARELAVGTEWDHVTRDGSDLWQSDWLKLSQNCHQSWTAAVGETHIYGERSFPVPSRASRWSPASSSSHQMVLWPEICQESCPVQSQWAEMLLKEWSKPNWLGLCWAGKQVCPQTGAVTSRRGMWREV